MKIEVGRLKKGQYLVYAPKNRNYVEIITRGGAIIMDLIHFAKIFPYFSIRLNTLGYAVCHKRGTPRGSKSVYLHHLVVGKPKKPYVVDHINRDKGDNRTSNLRIVDISTNVLNCVRSEKAEFVSFRKRRKEWVFDIKRMGLRHTAYFETKEKAIEYRDNFMRGLQNENRA